MDQPKRRAVVLTALEVEYRAVASLLQHLHEDPGPQGAVYERGLFEAEGQTWEVCIHEIGAGNANAALATERIIAHFKPQVAFFVGVAGGIKDVGIGDVVAATKIYGYESGKAEEAFRTRPEVGESTYRMIERARVERRKDDWMERLAAVPETKPRVFMGPVAAGEKVVASTTSAVYQFLRSSYGDALAVEMEGRGFLEATRTNAAVDALVVRGISDMIEGKAEADKSGSQEAASRHAAAFAFQVLAKLYPKPEVEAAERENEAPYPGPDRGADEIGVEVAGKGNVAAPNTFCALLVDFDNVWFGLRGTGVRDIMPESIAMALHAIASRFGPIATAKVYASNPTSVRGAIEAFRERGYDVFTPDNPSKGAGIQIALDGYSLLSIRPEIETYVLASGDSHFAPLARSIVEHHKTLIVVTAAAVASKVLRSYADEFVPLEQVLSKEQIQAPRSPVRQSLLPEQEQFLRRPLLRVFLCHSTVDKPVVRELYSRLKRENFVRPWLDEQDLLPGQDWEREITKAVRDSHCVLACLSKQAANRAGYLHKEIRFALDVADRLPEGTIFLIPTKLDECEVPERLRRYQWVNLFEADGYASLRRALDARAAGLI